MLFTQLTQLLCGFHEDESKTYDLSSFHCLMRVQIDDNDTAVVTRTIKVKISRNLIRIDTI